MIWWAITGIFSILAGLISAIAGNTEFVIFNSALLITSAIMIGNEGGVYLK